MKVQRVRKRRWPWLVAVVVGLGSIAVVVKGSRAKPAPLDPALLLTAEKRPMRLEVLETGRIQPREKVELKSKVAGQVIEVRVPEGAHVEKGQLLLVIDPTDIQREVAKAVADVAAARSAVEFARAKRDRAKRGLDTGVVSVVELEAATFDERAKQAQLDSLDVVLAAARDRLRYTKIYAPMSGTVIQRGVEPGEMVVPGVVSTFDGKALLTIADLSTLLAKVNLNQIDVARVSIGQKATLTLDALPGKSYTGVMLKVAPASVKLTGKDQEVFPVEVLVENVDAAIKPGMTADVRVLLDEKGDTLALPIEALSKEGAKSFATRVLDEKSDKQRTERVEVAVGARTDRDVEILSGLSAGDRILLKPPSAAENETKL